MGGGGRGMEMQQWGRRPISGASGLGNAGSGVEGLFLGLTVQGEGGERGADGQKKGWMRWTASTGSSRHRRLHLREVPLSLPLRSGAWISGCLFLLLIHMGGREKDQQERGGAAGMVARSRQCQLQELRGGTGRDSKRSGCGGLTTTRSAN